MTQLLLLKQELLTKYYETKISLNKEIENFKQLVNVSNIVDKVIPTYETETFIFKDVLSSNKEIDRLISLRNDLEKSLNTINQKLKLKFNHC